jgi:hypothetical protein
MTHTRVAWGLLSGVAVLVLSGLVWRARRHGWRVVQKGRTSLPVCAKSMRTHSPKLSQIRAIGNTPARSPYLRGGPERGMEQLSIYIKFC